MNVLNGRILPDTECPKCNGPKKPTSGMCRACSGKFLRIIDYEEFFRLIEVERLSPGKAAKRLGISRQMGYEIFRKWKNANEKRSIN